MAGLGRGRLGLLLLVLCLLLVSSAVIASVAEEEQELGGEDDAGVEDSAEEDEVQGDDGDDAPQECSGSFYEVIKLSNGVEMPKVGFGLAGMKGEATRECVRDHLARGFKLMDGAESTEWYDDESAGDELGKIDSVKREDVFIVSKIHPTRLSFEEAAKSVFEMLQRWNRTTYLDMVLLHYPECGSWIPNCKDKTGGDWKGAYRAMEEHYKAGRIRALGVSNFDVPRLNELWEFAEIKPHAIQNWLDPFFQSRDLVEWAKAHDVAFTSYSSFGMQWQFNWVKKNLVFESQVLRKIADAVDQTVTGVILAWLIKKNIAVIPRSTNPEHIAANAYFLEQGYADEILSPEQIARIDALDGVFDADPRDVCERVYNEGRCGDDGAGGWCRATCAGLDW